MGRLDGKNENKRTELMTKVKVSWLADQLKLPLIGSDLHIERVRPLTALAEGSLSFASSPLLAGTTPYQVAVIGPAEAAADHITVLVSDTPRLHFALALQLLSRQVGFREETEEARIHPSVKVGKNTFIGRGAVIGENTVIGHHVVIEDGVSIGRNCWIKSGAVIGEEGFGFERDLDGIPMHMPHLGSVRVEDDVQIGSLSTVCRGTLQDTVIERYAKIDDHVHVGHNCRIAEGAMLTAGTILGGGSVIGRYAWLGLNASTLQKVTIGDHAYIGMGAVVIQNVGAHQKLFGNPARVISK
ncbi:DapH/DapD/GlmU-related protein [Marinicrinis lubricantis]|uniref:DapH/DapD/GlmU-related protein n=1 Tax=Marinicrinis lubricantis TaxID=2086470 RepID=A0ABW1IQV9_9BACL